MVVLASNSPRRKALLKQIINDFICIDANIDENISYCLPYLECVKDLAKRKAKEGQKFYPNDLVIGADTIVVFNGNIVHKPVDRNDAFHILNMLSNQTHQVVTSYCILKGETEIVKTVISEVKFYPLSEHLIERYIEEKKPFDKAGSYGIQESDKTYPIVESFKGSYTNIVGLPIEELIKDLKPLLI